MPPAKRFYRNLPDTDRLALITLEGTAFSVRAQFNPREVQVDKSITWSEARSAGSNSPDLQYTTGNSRTMTLELMLDCYEDTTASIEGDLATLHQMALAPDPGSKTEAKRMPPVLEVVNGPIPGFRCVIESIAIKATLFRSKMVPVRATVSLKLKEVVRRDIAERGKTRAAQLASNHEAVFVRYQPPEEMTPADRERAAAQREQDEKNRVAREAIVALDRENGHGTFTQAEVDQLTEDKAARDQATRTKWLADNGLEPQ